MSTDFYARLEQRRGARPSPETVQAIARALRLDADERDHLHRLAGHVPPPRTDHPGEVSFALLRVLDRLDSPAMVVSALGEVLAQNAMGNALLGRQTDLPGRRRSVYWRWFTEPAERERWPEEDHPIHSRAYVRTLRAVHGTGDARAADLVDALLGASPEFAELWAQHEVGARTDTRKRIDHPLVGRLTLDCQVLTSEDGRERLVVFTPLPGSEEEDRLRLLDVLGTQSFGHPSA